jgi:hypothetical protein
VAYVAKAARNSFVVVDERRRHRYDLVGHPL